MKDASVRTSVFLAIQPSQKPPVIGRFTEAGIDAQISNGNKVRQADLRRAEMLR